MRVEREYVSLDPRPTEDLAMSPQSNEQVDFDRDPAENVESAEELLLEIAEDARRVKHRYARETVVPEGGE
jgi:hypothetical protein